MDSQWIVSELGGGLPALIIVALAWAWVQERRRSADVQDARIQDQKEVTAQILEATRTLEAAIRALEGR